MEMKVLLHNEIRRMSVPVTDIESEVRPFVKAMTEICNRKLNGRIGLALAHCQIEIAKQHPLTFYVLSNGDAIINPTIISVSEKSLKEPSAEKRAEKKELKRNIILNARSD